MKLSDPKTVLQLENIKKVFFPGSFDEVTALNGVNLEVKDGDFVTIIGSNGAGKSTMLNVVAGVFPPEKGGKVIINDRDVTRIPEYKHSAYVGRVWQQPGVGTAKDLTIEENLSMAVMRAKRKGLRLATNKKRREQFREALSLLRFGLEDRLNALVGTLSGGQRQALSLVMATISKPSILLLDEHIASLDPKTAKTVMELTGLIVGREKMTAMMVTHNMDIALAYGTRLVMMHQGKILVDIEEDKKKTLTVDDLISAFENAAGERFSDDKVMLKEI